MIRFSVVTGNKSVEADWSSFGKGADIQDPFIFLPVDSEPGIFGVRGWQFFQVLATLVREFRTVRYRCFQTFHVVLALGFYAIAVAGGDVGPKFGETNALFTET